MTSCGLNDGPLKGKGNYPSYIACNVYGKKGTRFLSMIKHPKSGHPYLTQEGKDQSRGQISILPICVTEQLQASNILTCVRPLRFVLILREKQLELFMYPQRKAASQWQDSGKTLQGTARFCS